MMWRWRQRIQDTQIPLQTFEPLAKKWDTCAVGEAQEKNPDLGRRVELDDLGIDFWKAVRDGQRSTAGRLLTAIQRRVRSLLRRR